MLNAARIKKAAGRIGLDLCGIAPAARFAAAPAGFRPEDIYKNALSVIVVARRLPAASPAARSPVPYTFLCDEVLREVFRMTVDLVRFLEENNVVAVPVPSEPYEYWDAEKREGRGILSLKHAGYLAGLGVLGKNTLLNNKKYGNMITLSAVLADREFKADDIADDHLNCDPCNLCISSCPQKALDGRTVNQKLCREKSQVTNARGYTLYECNLCRRVCPKS